MEQELHWYAFTFQSGNATGSVYRGFPQQLVTVPRIETAKTVANMPPNSVLIGLAYLGLMSHEVVTNLE